MESSFNKSIAPNLFVDLQKIISDTQPSQSILIANNIFTRECVGFFDKICCDTYLPNEIPINPSQYYGLGIVWCLNAELARKQADHQIADLRDRLCERLYIYELIGHSPLKSKLCRHLGALGFRLVKTYDNIALFYFDIYDYKQVPDWLNDQFWANPELWGKMRF